MIWCAPIPDIHELTVSNLRTRTPRISGWIARILTPGCPQEKHKCWQACVRNIKANVATQQDGEFGHPRFPREKSDPGDQGFCAFTDKSWVSRIASRGFYFSAALVQALADIRADVDIDMVHDLA